MALAPMETALNCEDNFMWETDSMGEVLRGRGKKIQRFLPYGVQSPMNPSQTKEKKNRVTVTVPNAHSMTI